MNKKVFTALNLILFVMFIELIRIVFNLKGLALRIELVLLVVFLLAAIISMVRLAANNHKAIGTLLVLFSLSLLNILLLYFNFNVRSAPAFILGGISLLGSVLSVSVQGSRRPRIRIETKMDFAPPEPKPEIILEDDFKPKKKAKKKAVKKKKKTKKKSKKKKK